MELVDAVHYGKRVFKGITSYEQMDIARNYCVLIMERMQKDEEMTDSEWDHLINSICIEQSTAEKCIMRLQLDEKLKKSE